MAAKHTGHCQICARQQKVTGTKLARHGYTLAHGWQMGVCFGSDRQPYELSNEALNDAIARAQAFIASTNTLIERLTACPLDDDGKVFATIWRGHEHAVSTVTIGTDIEGKIEFRDYNGAVVGLYGRVRATTVDGAARELADRRIKSLGFAIKKSEASIVFMAERRDAWKPAQLTPIADADQTPAVPTMHYKVKRYGYTTTACSASASGAQRNTGKNMTNEASKVTCLKCEKEAARLAAKGLTKAAI